MARFFAPWAVARPRWLLDYVRSGGPPDLTVPNLAPPGGEAPTFFGAYGEWMGTPPPTWDDIAWMREQWGGRFLVKGIMHPDDARRAVQAGADAISVSNHGGNNLDGSPASIRALPGVAEAVGGEIEVLFDGGIRRGSDVVKALALGARAVLIGRAYLWGMAANGEAGVANVLEILRAGIEETLVALGRASIHDLTPDDVLMPPGFADLEHDHGDEQAPATAPAVSTPPAILCRREVAAAFSRPFSACSSARSSSRSAHSNSSESIASAGPGSATSAGPGVTSMITPPVSTTCRPRPTATRYAMWRSRCCSRRSSRRSMNGGRSLIRRRSSRAPRRARRGARRCRSRRRRRARATRPGTGCGSTASPPSGWISKCRCGGVGSASPVLPT